MASSTAQDEFNALFSKNGYTTGRTHPEDKDSSNTAVASDASSQHSGSANNGDHTFLDDEDNDDDDTSRTSNMAVNTNSGSYYIPRATRQANTGPKGVIADAQAFEQARRAALSNANLPKKSKRLGSFSRHSPPATYDFDKSSGSDEDDEGFMARWRQRRLMELSNKPFGNVLGRNGAAGKKVYGHLSRVDAEGYLDAIEKAPEDTVVVVLIYDHTSEISILVEDAVREMARAHTTTRFIKLHFAEAEFEPAGVPALLAYRGGDKFAGFVPVSDEIPDTDDLSARSLTRLLQRHQVL